MSQPTLDAARGILSRYFGYPDFRAPQLPAIEAALSGRDAVIVLPTGGGKSICFQVPALCRDGLTVVVSPLISLMADQVQALERRGIGSTYLNSTLTPDETASRVARIRAGEVRLLYLAPERLAVGTTSSLLAQVGVAMLAVDEAHCVSEWGQDFRPSYLQLPALRRQFNDPQTVALTATATPRVRTDIARLLELRNPVEVIGGFDRPNLTFRVKPVKDDAHRNLALIQALRATTDPVVVYAATRRQVEQVVRILSSGRVRAVGYHAGLEPERRARAQDAFMGSTIPVIVATNAFGMGIDKPNVRLVVHYLHSGSLEDYYQEAGRAGRDGARSNCLLLFNTADRGIHDRMREGGKPPIDLVRETWLALANASRGRTHVALDAETVARQVAGRPGSGLVRQALDLLQERGIIATAEPDDAVQVRLIASDLRLACEEGQLSRAASALLSATRAASPSAHDWRSVSRSSLSLSPWQFTAGMEELESRQLVYVDRVPPRAVVADGTSDRARLERCLSQLRLRRKAERLKLDAMVGYATTTKCRRAFILGYFGEATGQAVNCGECDVCAP